MKTILLNFKRAMFLAVMSISSLFMFGENCNFWDTNGTMLTFEVNGSNQSYELDKNVSDDFNFNIVDSLKLVSFMSRTWKNGGGNICGTYLYYRIYKEGTTPPAFKQAGARSGYLEEKIEDGNTKQIWRSRADEGEVYHPMSPISILKGLEFGNYVFECYLSASGDQNGNAGCYDNVCYYSNNNNNYKFKFTVGLNTYVSKFNKDDVKCLSLYAPTIGSQYKFDKSTDGQNWQTIATQSGNKLDLIGNDIPTETTIYRVTCNGKSSTTKIEVVSYCEDGTQHQNILKYDFGTLSSKTARKGKESDFTMKNHDFRDYPELIDDGDYAIVATPYKCGCGKGLSQGCDHCHTVENCDQDCGIGHQYPCNEIFGEGGKHWFRNLFDITYGEKGANGSFGGMLFINFAAATGTAFEQDIPEDKVKLFQEGSTLTFSAYFANATRGGTSSNPINMKLKITKSDDGNNWSTITDQTVDVKYEQNWLYGSTKFTFEAGSNPSNSKYKIIIENNGVSGVGNDVLIDGISLDLCTLPASLEFYDKTTGKSYQSFTYEKLADNELIRLQKKEFGVGDPKVYLFSVNPSIEEGAGRYNLVGEMPLSSNYYTLEASARTLIGKVFTDKSQISLPYNGQIQAVVIKSDKVEEVLEKIKNGGYKKEGETAVYKFSENLLTYNIECKDVTAATLSSTKQICESSGKLENDLPNLNVTFGNSSEYVKLFLTATNGTASVNYEKALTAADIAAGKTSIALKDVPDIDNVRIAGNINFVVTKKEYFSGFDTKEICVNSADAISLTVVNKPSYDTDQWKTTVEKCDGSTQNISVTAQNATYTWQVLKKGSSEWEDAEGTNDQAKYVIPKTGPETGWKYRVILSNQYCTNVTSNETTLTVNICDKVLLSINADKTELCKGEDVKFTVTIQNNGTVDVNDLEITEDISSMTGLQFVKAETSAGAFTSNKWTVSLAVGAQATLELIYKSVSDDTVDNIEKVYVSKLGSTNWTSYDAQTDVTMKSEWGVKSKGVSATPICTPYNKCATNGTKQLSDLVSSDKTALQWFENPELTIVVDPATFDMNVPVKNKKYYVVNTEDGKCVSDKAEATVTVKDYATEADITAVGQAVCKGSEVSLIASTTTVAPNPIFRWYSDAALTDKLFEGNPYKVTPTEEGSYYISVENQDYCENLPQTGAEVKITIIQPVTLANLTPKEELIGLGASTTKTLTVEPAEADIVSKTWTVNGDSFDGLFPRKPYTDQQYKVMIVDKCGNNIVVEAKTEVEWPTIFTPYNVDGSNDDFVKGLDRPISIQVYDRTGNMVYEGSDGWAGESKNGTLVMPGVYYYVATLPDGSTRKATVEVYK